MIPGVDVMVTESAPPDGAASDTGKWFVTGQAPRGPVDRAVPVSSLSGFHRVFGDDPDMLEGAVTGYYMSGGRNLVVGRVVASDAAVSSVTLNDAASADAIVVEAASPGVWGDALKVEVAAGSGGYVLIVTEDGVEVDRSPVLADNAAAAAWSLTSDVVRVTAAGTSPPAVVAATALTGGGDGGTPTDADWQAALDLFTRDLGPGQVSHPGRTTPEAHAQVIVHAAANNRVPLLDAPDTGVVGTLTSLATTDRAVGGARRAALLAPWAVIPAVAPGATRTIPYSAVQAGLLARVDGVYGPGQNAAGLFAGVADSVVGVTQEWGDDDREALNAAGVTVARLIGARVVTYGMRSLADPTADPGWVGLQNARVVMAVQAEAEAVGERFLFRQIDGSGQLVAEYGGELTAMLRRHYDAGALYGANPDDAFRVDVGPLVNTPETLAANELHAVIRIRVSPGAEHIVINIVKRRVEEVV